VKVESGEGETGEGKAGADEFGGCVLVGVGTVAEEKDSLLLTEVLQPSTEV
jgi:hypothetical protein